MKVTVKKLKNINACSEAIEKFKEHGDCELIELIEEMIKKKYKLDWANWLIVRFMNRKQYIPYAMYAAEQVIDIYEKEYPDDKRPRLAIEAAKKYINNPNIKNKENAHQAAVAVQAAYVTADAAVCYTRATDTSAIAIAIAAIYVTDAAIHAIHVATHTNSIARAGHAADVAVNAIRAGHAAITAIYVTANVAKIKMQIKILKYGIKLLKA